MGYGDHLKALLRPLGLYRLENSINGSELESIGQQLDLVSNALEDLEREMNPLTAEGWGLTKYSALMAHKPAAGTAEELTSLLRLHGGVLTPALAADALSALGLNTSVAESGGNRVTVTFHTQPGDMDRAKEAIEALFPCHLTITYE